MSSPQVDFTTCEYEPVGGTCHHNPEDGCDLIKAQRMLAIAITKNRLASVSESIIFENTTADNSNNSDDAEVREYVVAEYWITEANLKKALIRVEEASKLCHQNILT